MNALKCKEHFERTVVRPCKGEAQERVVNERKLFNYAPTAHNKMLLTLFAFICVDVRDALMSRAQGCAGVTICVFFFF